MKGKSKLAAVDYEGLGNYNSVIEFLVKLYPKSTICLLPTYGPCLGYFSEYSEKYVQKRARKAA